MRRRSAALASLAAVVVASLVPCQPASAQAPIVRANLDSSGRESKSGGAVVPRVDCITGDGRFVVFMSGSSDLVPADTNDVTDVFLRDLVGGTTTRISVAPDGSQGDRASGSSQPTISSDGRFLAFDSEATNLVPSDTNGVADIFLLDRDPDGNGLLDEQPIALERVNVAFDGGEANGWSDQPSLSTDGKKVAFRSDATNLISVDSNGTWDVFVRNRKSGTTSRASRSNTNAGGDFESGQPQMAADGSAVVFGSLATNFGTSFGPFWQVWVRDLVADRLELASSDPDGDQLSDASFSGRISGDGRFVVFHTRSHGLVPENDPSNLSEDVFVKDRQTGQLACMTIGPDGFAGHSANTCTISTDGLFVAFSSPYDGFVPGDTNGEYDVFVRDVTTQEIRCATIDCSGAPAAGGVGTNFSCALSSDGRYALFSAAGTEYVSDDTNIYNDLFVHDLANPGFQAAWSNYGAGWPGTRGVPTFTLDVDPEFGATATATASNTLGFWTAGFLALGFARADWPTNRGGSIAVDFVSLTAVVVPPSGYVLCAEIPYDSSLCGVEVDLQLIEFDPGASHDLSFTPGLAIVFGR